MKVFYVIEERGATDYDFTLFHEIVGEDDLMNVISEYLAKKAGAELTIRLATEHDMNRT